MSEELYKIASILEASIKKNGDKPITLSHLLNIIRMAERQLERDENEDWMACILDDLSDYGDRN